MTPQERYRQVAALHAANINQGFLATLGVPFLALMYRAMDEAESSVLLTEEQGERIVGFVSGGAGMGAIYRRMLRYPVRLGLSLLPSLIRPKRLKRIVEIMRYGGGGPPGQALPRAELLSIAVAADARGTGLAESLYRRLAAYFRANGVDEFKITAGDALTPAHRFYRRMGAVSAGKTEVHSGEASTIYVHRTTVDDGAQ